MVYVAEGEGPVTRSRAHTRLHLTSTDSSNREVEGLGIPLSPKSNPY